MENRKVTQYASIVFLQEHEALEAIDKLYDNGLDALFDYLLLWDNGEYHYLSKSSFAGSSDTIHSMGNGYYISINHNLPYVGLEKIITITKQIEQ